jgi:gas vesicle protein
MQSILIQQPFLQPLSRIGAAIITAFGVGELTTGTGLLSALIGGVVAIVVVLLTRQPQREQNRQSLEAAARQAAKEDAAIHSTETAGIIDNLVKVHAEEKKAILEAAAHAQGFFQERILYLSNEAQVSRSVRELVRISKHNALSEVNKSYFYIRALQEICKNCKVDITSLPSFEFKEYEDICGVEDKQIAKLFLDHQAVV